jgi:hypothetical protein
VAQGCNFKTLYDFERWANESVCGQEPLDGPLLFHAAWNGPTYRIVTELRALFDSFIITQQPDRFANSK